MNVRILFAALPLLSVGLWAAQPATNEVVLPERLLPQLNSILQGAVQQSPRMLSRALDLEIAENNRIAARAGLLPSASAYYTYYEARDDRADISGRQNVSKVYYNASIAQPIFHWGERRNNARIGQIQQHITQGQYREGYRLLVQELRSSYMRLIVQKVALQRTRFYREFAGNQLKQQEERLAKKIISEVEISTARLTDEQAQISLDRAEYDYEAAKASFARVSGMAKLSDDAIPDMVPAAAYPAGAIDQLLAGFLSQSEPPSTEAVNLRNQLEIEKLNYSNQRTRLLPKFNLVLGASQDEQSYSLNVAQKYRVNSLYGGFSLNWMIFDGFAAGAAQRNSLARRRQIENDYRQISERLAQDAQTQAKQINFSARNMSIYDRFLVSGEGYLKTVKEDFARGIKSEADVSQAQLSLFDAQINANNARIDYLLKVGDFLGILMEDPALSNISTQ